MRSQKKPKTLRLRRWGVALGLGLWLSSCYPDELTAPRPDVSTIVFDVSGDSIMYLGDTLRLTTGFEAGDGTGATRITWVSQDSAVAMVDDATGHATATGVGAATIASYLVAPELDDDLLRT